MGWPRSVPINVIIFGEVSKVNAQWTAKCRSMFLLNGIPSWIYSQLSFHVLSRMSKYHTNQNDLTLPNPVYRTPIIAHGVCSSLYINQTAYPNHCSWCLFITVYQSKSMCDLIFLHLLHKYNHCHSEIYADIVINLWYYGRQHINTG